MLAENIETKVTFYAASGQIQYSGTIASLTANLVQGDGSIDRLQGVQLSPKKLTMRYSWVMSSATSYNRVRLMVFRWNDAVLPVPAGILHEIGTVNAPLSPLYWTNRQKIKVLYDHTEVLYDTGAGLAASYHTATMNLKGKITFPNVSGAGAVPQNGGLYVMYITDDALTPAPIVSLYTELTYTDA